MQTDQPNRPPQQPDESQAERINRVLSALPPGAVVRASEYTKATALATRQESQQATGQPKNCKLGAYQSRLSRVPVIESKAEGVVVPAHRGALETE